MVITLTPELERRIEEQLELGLYENKDQVVRHALERLARDILQAEINKGFEDIEASQVVKFTPKLLDDIKRQGRERRS